MPPTISIVTPCLNAAATIGRTLDSVASQGYLGVEHVVVDGGSTDGTLELLAQFPEVKVISEPDEGLSDAVNKGIALASGELVGWLNADDWYLPGALAAVAVAAEANPGAEWFTGGCPIVDGTGRQIPGGVTPLKELPTRPLPISALPEPELHLMPSNFHPGVSA